MRMYPELDGGNSAVSSFRLEGKLPMFCVRTSDGGGGAPERTQPLRRGDVPRPLFWEMSRLPAGKRGLCSLERR